LSVLAIGAVALTLGVGSAVSGDRPLPLPVTHQHFNFLDPTLGNSSDGGVSSSTPRTASGALCSTVYSSAANVDTDREGLAPHNETSIAVNPTSASNEIGNANDYQLSLSPDGTVFETIYSRAHATFDGGHTGTSYPISFPNYTSTGDPAVAFDAHGNAYLPTLGFSWSQNRFCCTTPDVLVAHSSDGGQTWSTPSRVAGGTGRFSSPGVFNDKEYIAAWGNGNAIVTGRCSTTAFAAPTSARRSMHRSRTTA
jgi:hypothetical protein